MTSSLTLQLLIGLAALFSQPLSTETVSYADLVALGGASPSQVAAFFDATEFAPTPSLPETPCSEGLYTFKGGSASVQFCRDRAYAFHLVFNRATNSPSALLARAGLSLGHVRLSGLVLAEDGPSHRLWMHDASGAVSADMLPAERLLLSQGPDGWTQITLEFAPVG